MKISELKGVGPKKEQALAKLGIFTQEDLLYFFPRTYEDRRKVLGIEDLKEGEEALIKGLVVMIVKDRNKYKKQQTLRLLLQVDDANIEVVFFNARFLINKFQQGKEYFFFGKVSYNMGRLQMTHPEFSSANDNVAEITPVYPLTMGISQRDMRLWQKSLENLAQEAEEYLPVHIIDKNNLCSINFALKNIHFPKEPEELKAAKYRLIFDELFILQLGLLMMKIPTEKGIKFGMKTVEEEYIGKMPYSLTKAQRKVTEEIIRDMESSKVMNRLLQGDVGSGKTAVAEIALFKAVKNSYQGAFMAPTDILVKQHYKGFKKAFEPYGINVAYLSGGMSTKEKNATLEDLEKGTIDILIGTHAIIQPNVVFKNLGIVITDEQHRFGVNQRSLLKEKGDNPDILVMTATPIPRTLAVILYGDMDVSVIDELPPGRKEIKTKAVTEKARDKVYRFVEEELREGRQAYIVAPLIEDSENLDIKSAESIYEELKSKFSNHEVALIHGGMKQSEKDEIMQAFNEGKYEMLVATVVIEVGINVPNATVMVIENAERFGLAQLHQLRGRVGRGNHQSYCILITEGKGEIAMERARTMATTTDGFVIAEKDLELRGPGELFGTRQHGIPDMRLADMVKHINIMEKVRYEAVELMKEDKELKNNPPLKKRVESLFGEDINMKL